MCWKTEKEWARPTQIIFSQPVPGKRSAFYFIFLVIFANVVLFIYCITLYVITVKIYWDQYQFKVKFWLYYIQSYISCHAYWYDFVEFMLVYKIRHRMWYSTSALIGSCGYLWRLCYQGSMYKASILIHKAVYLCKYACLFSYLYTRTAECISRVGTPALIRIFLHTYEMQQDDRFVCMISFSRSKIEYFINLHLYVHNLCYFIYIYTHTECGTVHQL